MLLRRHRNDAPCDTRARAMDRTARGAGLALAVFSALASWNARAADWREVGSDGSVSVQIDTRTLRSDAQRVETWVRYSFYGGRQEIGGVRAGSVSMAQMHDCGNGTVRVRLLRHHEEPGGTGRLLSCREFQQGFTPVNDPQLPHYMNMRAVHVALCSDPRLRNRRPFPDWTGEIWYGPGRGGSYP
jgi:hypothetical protein